MHILQFSVNMYYLESDYILQLLIKLILHLVPLFFSLHNYKKKNMMYNHKSITLIH